MVLHELVLQVEDCCVCSLPNSVPAVLLVFLLSQACCNQIPSVARTYNVQYHCATGMKPTFLLGVCHLRMISLSYAQDEYGNATNSRMQNIR
jgi:hypothetical protein